MVEIQEDLLDENEKAELELTGNVTAKIERFVVISGLNFNTLGPLMTPARVRQSVNYHKNRGNPVRFHSDSGEVKLVQVARDERYL
jgi:hypothetical protein